MMAWPDCKWTPPQIQTAFKDFFLFGRMRLSRMRPIEFEVLQNGDLPGGVAGDGNARRVRLAEIIQPLYPGGGLRGYRRGAADPGLFALRRWGLSDHHESGNPRQ